MSGNVLGTFDAIIPEHQVVYEGSIAHLYCITSTNPVWMKNGIPMVLKTVSKSLTLVNVKEEDSGIYSCQGVYLNVISFSNTSLLLVASKFISPLHEIDFYN